jgi:hypothetical protein
MMLCLWLKLRRLEKLNNYVTLSYVAILPEQAFLLIKRQLMMNNFI